MDDSAITCDEIIESYDKKTEAIPINYTKNKAFFKIQNFYIFLAFLLITLALLMC